MSKSLWLPKRVRLGSGRIPTVTMGACRAGTSDNKNGVIARNASLEGVRGQEADTSPLELRCHSGEMGGKGRYFQSVEFTRNEEKTQK